MDNDLKAFIAKIEGWMDAERAGLSYDRATSFCSDCPHRWDADDDENTAPSCCKEDEDYQAQEFAALEKVSQAVKVLRELLKEFEVQS